MAEGVTEAEFRVGHDHYGVYIFHAPLNCDWEWNLGEFPPSLAELREIAEAHERECDKRSGE